MEKKLIDIDLIQGEGENQMQMYVDITIELAEKMGEIRSRDPQKWVNRDFDLLDEAKKELGYKYTGDFHFEFLGGNNKTTIAAITINGDTIYRQIYNPLENLFPLRTQIEQIILRKEGSILWGVGFKTDEIKIEGFTEESDDVFLQYIIYDNLEDEEAIISSFCNIKQVIGSIYLAYLKLITTTSEKKINIAYYNSLKSDIIESYLFNKQQEIKEYELLEPIREHYDMKRDFEILVEDAYPEYEKLSIVKTIDNPIKKEMADIAKRFLNKAHKINFEKKKDLTELIKDFKHIRIREGYKLGYYSKGDGANYNSNLEIRYKYNDVEITRDNISQYFEFDFTELAIWEMYILTRMSITFLPKGWHGAYKDHKLIADYEDLVQIVAQIGCSDSNIKIMQILANYNNPNILPDIKITSPTTAKISAALFTKYGGLQIHTTDVKYIPDTYMQEMTFTESSKPVTLVKYESGEWF